MVTFTNKKIKKSNTGTQRRAIKRKVYKKRKTFTKYLLKFLLFLLLLWTIIVIVWSYILYNKYIKPLPDIQTLSDIKLPKSSTIYDRNWEILYNVFKEKRTYVEFEKINKNMINAIIAWEDQRFWTNPWYDLIWLTRAWIEAIKNWWDIWGTSTISQQLIKNTLLTNERSIERKIKEIYLSYKMTKAFDKKKILELYLNKISFWNNAFWIEQASKTYFKKSAKDLTKLEASILASMPKWPSLFSPYKFKDSKWNLTWYARLMWYPYVYSEDIIKWVENEDKKKVLIKNNQINILPNVNTKKYINEISTLKSVLNNIKIKRLQVDWDNLLICWLKKENIKWFISLDNSWCSVINYSELLPLLNNIRIKVWKNYIEYQTWRKDFILWRMLEDWYIENEDYKKSLINWILFKFEESKTKIKYPHFVFYVIEYLEEKYWKETIEEEWFKIYTTLDSNIQEKAQKIVSKYSNINKKNFWSNNASSIVLDNQKWEIIAMVWSKDYYDKEIGWENNIMTSKLQPWSTFKPFVYALAMEKNQIWPKTPVFDVKTKFPWDYEPNNFDGKFMNKMSIESALNHSRNIPAIKMYYLSWKEKAVIEFMRKIWVESYYDFKKYYRKKYWKNYNYWAPMALWTWEMTWLELATAYSTIASLWKKKEITPILKIYDSNWAIIEDLSRVKPKQVISEATSYLITSVLTNKEARPDFWNKYLTLSWRKVAAKTWTSTKQYKKNWKKYIFPQNLWTIWYTPQYTTIAWVWNTDWTELNDKWNWLEWAWPIWKEIMEEVHSWKKALDWKRPNNIKEVIISSNSWKIPSWVTPNKSKVKWLFINSPTSFDDSYFSKQIDSLCNWKVTEDTPKDAIKNIVWVRYHSLRPNDPSWEYPVSKLSSYWDIEFKNEVCERTEKPSEKMKLWVRVSWWWNLVEWSNYIELAYESKVPIIRLDIILDWNKVASYELPWKLKWWYRWAFNVSKWLSWNKNLIVKAVDNQYYAQTISRNVTIWWKDKKWPNIIIENPSRWKISLNSWTSFNLRFSVNDASPIRTTNISLNWKSIASWLTKRKIVVPISSLWLETWIHNLIINSTDKHFNTSTKVIKVNILD